VIAAREFLQLSPGEERREKSAAITAQGKQKVTRAARASRVTTFLLNKIAIDPGAEEKPLFEPNASPVTKWQAAKGRVATLLRARRALERRGSVMSIAPPSGPPSTSSSCSDDSSRSQLQIPTVGEPKLAQPGTWAYLQSSTGLSPARFSQERYSILKPRLVRSSTAKLTNHKNLASLDNVKDRLRSESMSSGFITPEPESHPHIQHGSFRRAKALTTHLESSRAPGLSNMKQQPRNTTHGLAGAKRRSFHKKPTSNRCHLDVDWPLTKDALQS